MKLRIPLGRYSLRSNHWFDLKEWNGPIFSKSRAALFREVGSHSDSTSRNAALAVGLALVLLTGCSGTRAALGRNPFLSGAYVASSFSYSTLMSMTTGRTVPVRVLGTAFGGMPQSEFASKVVAAMPNGFLNRTTYGVNPGGIAGTGLRILWNFDPDPRDSVDNLCLGRTSGTSARQPPPAPGTARQVRAVTALCQDDYAYVATYGGVDVTGPDDPRFADFISQMTISTLLSPPTDAPSGLGLQLGL